MTNHLRVSQQYEFESLAELGCSPVDCLIVGCGFTPEQADKVRDNANLLLQWEQSRARGAAKILTAMSEAAAAGSSSAAKLVLEQHGSRAEEEQERTRERRRAGRAGPVIDVTESVNAGFEAQRLLLCERFPKFRRTEKESNNV